MNAFKMLQFIYVVYNCFCKKIRVYFNYIWDLQLELHILKHLIYIFLICNIQILLPLLYSVALT